MNKKILFLIIILAMIGVAAGLFFQRIEDNEPLSCTMEAKQCWDGSYVGRNPDLGCEFDPCTEMKEIGIADKIIIHFPKPNEVISNPVKVEGRARGFWFFEGDFPVEIYDIDDNLLSQHYASFVPVNPDDTWMTEDFINFEGIIIYDTPTTEMGYILFKKDNPSGNSDLDESFKLPIKF